MKGGILHKSFDRASRDAKIKGMVDGALIYNNPNTRYYDNDKWGKGIPS